jgi:extracellular factor (EF) 3-hydroxypalmitic acid methyl ester biosynthesis protein
MRSSALSDHADFTLLDFNHETVAHTGTLLNDVKRRAGRRTGIEMRQMSVHQVLRAALAQGRSSAPTESYDVVYCAGLFDYLADSTCKALVKLFHQWLTPGGLVVVANMNDSKPFRNFIEYLLDWHLIYRDSRALWTFCPDDSRAHAAVLAEPTTVNLFLQVRRPE